MKFIKYFIPICTYIIFSFILLSCKREMPKVANVITDINSSATVQVFSATVKAARNYVYLDAVPVSGTGLAFGGVFPGTAYSFKSIAGSHTFLIKDTLVTTTQAPLTFTQTTDAGKNYTVFTYDTITSPKQLTITNNIVIPNDTTCMLRFANFIYNTTAVANVDVYSYRRSATTPVFTNVATNTVTDFIPYASGLTDTLYVYATGTTTPLLVKKLVTTLTPTRSYTSVYEGSYKGTRDIATFATY